ncbi:unnamed protein product [Trichobilharzia szidati]|nr:unnamed protein product [Trichobilharzia szidati]
MIQNRFHHGHFNPEIYYQLNISADHFIELSQRDAEKCIESEMSRMRVTVNGKDESVNWTIVVNELPTDIKPVLKFFKSNIQKEQCINFKLITEEIARLTQSINTNLSNGSGFDLCRRGALYRKIGRLQEAKLDLVKSIEYEPNLSSTHWHIHFIHLLEGKLEEALNDLDQCMKCLHIVELTKNIFNLNNDTTITGGFSSKRKYSKNVQQFYENILHSKAFIYSLMNNWKLEAEVWTNLIQLNPTYELAYLKRAHTYLKLKMFQHSNTDFIKVLCLNPKSVEAQFQCGLYKYYNSSEGISSQIEFFFFLKYYLYVRVK